MATFIACYDLKETSPKPHNEFLEAAKQHGWEPWILARDNIWYRLPNTTLVGQFDSQELAVAAFKAIRPDAEKALGVSIVVEKWFVAKYVGANFNSDEKVPNA